MCIHYLKYAKIRFGIIFFSILAQSVLSHASSSRLYLVYPDVDREIFSCIMKEGKTETTYSLLSVNKTIREELLKTIHLNLTDEVIFSPDINLDQFTFFQINGHLARWSIEQLNLLEGKIFYIGDPLIINREELILFNKNNSLRLFNGDFQGREDYYLNMLKNETQQIKKNFCYNVLRSIYMYQNHMDLNPTQKGREFNSFFERGVRYYAERVNINHNFLKRRVLFELAPVLYQVAEAHFFSEHKEDRDKSISLYKAVLENSDFSYNNNLLPQFAIGKGYFFINSLIRLAQISERELILTDAAEYPFYEEEYDFFLSLGEIESITMEECNFDLSQLRGVRNIKSIHVENTEHCRLNFSRFSALDKLTILCMYDLEELTIPHSLQELMIDGAFAFFGDGPDFERILDGKALKRIKLFLPWRHFSEEKLNAISAACTEVEIELQGCGDRVITKSCVWSIN